MIQHFNTASKLNSNSCPEFQYLNRNSHYNMENNIATNMSDLISFYHSQLKASKIVGSNCPDIV